MPCERLEWGLICARVRRSLGRKRAVRRGSLAAAAARRAGFVAPAGLLDLAGRAHGHARFPGMMALMSVTDGTLIVIALRTAGRDETRRSPWPRRRSCT